MAPQDQLSRLESSVDKFARAHTLWARGQAMLVAVSGGVDSVVLFHLLRSLAGPWNLSLGVVHLNHGLRGRESDRDEKFVRNLAKEAGVPFFSKKVDVAALARKAGAGLEEAGRDARREFFLSLAQEHGYDRVATAHHADDNVETLLLSILRGAGPQGLSGMAPKKGAFVRPLLAHGRAAITGYARENRLKWREDASNQDPDFTRNRIRHDLLPLLRDQYNPRVNRALLRLAAITADEQDWWEGHVAPILLDLTLYQDEKRLELDAPRLEALHPAPARRVLRAGLKALAGTLGKFSWDQVEALRHLPRKTAGQAHLSHGVVARVERGRLILESLGDPSFRRHVAPPKKTASFCLEIPGPGTYALPGGQTLEVDIRQRRAEDFQWKDDPWEIQADAHALAFPLVLRSIEPGDRFQPLGMEGRKKVRAALAEARWSPEQRARAVVLLSGGRIAWVPGRAMAHWVRVREKTPRIFTGKVFLA